MTAVSQFSERFVPELFRRGEKSCRRATYPCTVVYLPAPAGGRSTFNRLSMRLIRSLLVLAPLLVAAPLAAQSQPGKTTPKTAPKIHLDSLELKVSPELERSLDELAQAVQSLALRIANDPHLRAAAVQVATGFVTTAQQVVAEQGEAIEHALKTAAERIATAETERKRQQTTKP